MNSVEYQVECQHCEAGKVYTPAPRFTKALEFEYDEKESDCGECDGTGLLWEECIGHLLPYTVYGMTLSGDEFRRTYTKCDCNQCDERKK